MGAGVVVLREGFEASLIVGIVLAFLDRTGRRDAFWPVWTGALAAIGLSAAFATALFVVGAEFEGRSEAIWEGTTMLVAASLLTWMIFWMRRQARTIKRELEARTTQALAAGSTLALGLVAFVGVLREGVETALFLLGTVEGSDPIVSAVGATLGLTLAIALGYAFYRGASRLDLRRFFTVTSVLLLLFAAWLLARGLHEFAEVGLLPESPVLLGAAFLALAAPAVYLFVRPRRTA